MAALDSANGHASSGANADRQSAVRVALADTAALEAYLTPRHVIDVLQDAAPAKLSTAQAGCARGRCAGTGDRAC